MSNRDIIKMSLGITEYPWSSDDDLEEAAAPAASQESTAQRRPMPTVTNISTNDSLRANGFPIISPRFHEQRQQQQTTASRMSQDRAEREFFWSYINGPYRAGASNSLPVGPGEGPYMSRVRHTPAAELQERAPHADYRRLMALRNLSRRMARQGRYSHLGRVPVSRINPGVVVPSEANSSIRTRRTSQWIFGRPSSGHDSARTVQSAPSPRTTRLATTLARIDEDETNNNPAQSAHALSDEETNLQDSLETEEVGDRGAGEEAAGDPTAGADAEPDAGADADTSGSTVALDESAPRDHSDVIDAPAADAAQDTPTPVGQNTEVTLAASETYAVPRNPRKRRTPGQYGQNREQLTVKEFNLSLLRLLECPVCLEWMEPPMCQCRRGHIVCGGCRARLSACPVCRTGFSSVRNRAMEGVAELVRYPCRHGCAREVSLRRRAGHEASCRARKYACPAPACADAPPLPHAALTAHFQSKHQSMIKLGCSHTFSMKVTAECRAEWLVRALEQHFHLRIDVDRVCGLLARVCYIGPLCDATNYTYEVHMESPHNSRKLSYARATHSDLESLGTSSARHDCFHLTFEQALHFMRSTRQPDADRLVDFTVVLARRDHPTPRPDSDS